MLATMLNVDPACSLANVENVDGWPRPWAQVGEESSDFEQLWGDFERFLSLSGLIFNVICARPSLGGRLLQMLTTCCPRDLANVGTC